MHRQGGGKARFLQGSRNKNISHLRMYKFVLCAVDSDNTCRQGLGYWELNESLPASNYYRD